MSYKEEMIKEFTNSVLNAGYRVFIAERGHYGFFTDSEGSKVISFAVDGLRLSVSGNYNAKNPRYDGTGWKIKDNIMLSLSKKAVDRLFFANVPQWASTDYTMTTLKQHLDTYQKTSKYTEIFKQHLVPESTALTGTQNQIR